MKPKLPNIKNLAARARRNNNGDTEETEVAEAVAEPPKTPPALSLFFMLSHLEEDGPVRLDGVKLAVLQGLRSNLAEAQPRRRTARPAVPRRVGRVRPEGRTATVAAPGLGPGQLADGPG